MISNTLIQSEIDNALSYFKKANYHEAIKILEKLIKKQSHFLIYWYLGHCYFRIYDYSSAIDCIKKSIKLKNPDILNLNFLAEIYLQVYDYDESVRLFNEVLKIDKTNINSLSKLAKTYFELGNLNVAEKYYNEVLKIEPNNAGAQYELIKLNDKYLTDDLIKKLDKDIITKDQDYLNLIFSKFVLAESFKKNKNYKQELKSLIDAHTLFLENNKIASDQEFNYFTNLLPKFMAKIKNSKIKLSCDLKPIFVMGLPRSGTTLIENIISSSDDNIDPGSETGVISQIFFSKNIISDYNSDILISNFNFEKDGFENLRSSFLDQYHQLKINTKKEVFIDKSLENLLYIDLISKIFPNAKFVYCKRNKYANLLGILKVFLPNIFWSHSIEKIIKFMNLYNNKIEEIISENKIKIKVIELEKFSHNPNEISKDLFNFLGINWHDKILINSINKKRIIKTVSNLQVRKKISKHDLSYLDNYLPFLRDYNIEKLI